MSVENGFKAAEMNIEKIKYIIAVIIYGTNGMMIRFVDLPSSAIVFYRALIGTITIYVILKLKGHKIDRPSVRKNMAVLTVSGVCLGLNWVFLFAAYKVTTVAIASLCNYTAPIIVIIILAVYNRRRPGLSTIMCVIAAAAGIVMVSGVLEGGADNVNAAGIAFGMAAAAGFVGIVLCNRRLKSIDVFDKTVVQMAIAAIVIFIYMFVENGCLPIPGNAVSAILLLVLGIVNTGIAYIFYFGGMSSISVESVAILGYLEPVVSILMSVFVLKESLTAIGIIGAVLLLGAAAWNELSQAKKNE